ncbi:MAG: hypothetical protein J7K84_11110 [Deltaproteobacteria bacterium]|nr:hypothetical protein [Deltaproteobacteria bacterium]
MIKIKNKLRFKTIKYVEAYNLETGLLIKFGSKSLQHKNVHNNFLIKKSNNQKHQGSRQ